ncbi:MAG TPA: PKD domain-containing protein [Thermoplasmata archaeon]|nr:PKD domain-containing protein [Thermoplasmata archaeon]
MVHRSLGRAVIGASIFVAVLLGSTVVPTPGVGNMSGGVGSPRELSPSPSSLLPMSTPPASEVEVAPAFTPSVGDELVGTLPASNSISVEVGLALTDPLGLAGLVSELYTAGTPGFHAFRSSSELARDFGPTGPALSSAETYFEGFGLTVSPSPDHLLLSVTGSSDRVAAAFGTSFEQYRAADGRSFFSHPTAARLPAVAPWTGVYGLGNVTPLVPALGGLPPGETEITPASSCLGSPSVLVPCQVWEAYNMSSLISGGTNGAGERIAVVDPYSSGERQPALASDLATFTSEYGLSVGTVNFVYPDPGSGNLNVSSNPSWFDEDALDLEWARASAPGATVDMTFSPNSGPGLYEAVDWLVAHQAADVISLSWGEPDVGIYDAFSMPCAVACNASTDGSYGILSPVLEFAAAEGIGVFAASGDCGAADGTSGVSTNFPASDPDVTGVGGTVLSVNESGDYLTETGWSGNASGAKAPGCSNQGGSGGGYSPFPRPGWQSGLPSGTTKRGVPDVALDAGTPVSIVLGGGNTAVEGTSVATPIWAGIAAIADQNAGRPLGLLDPALYAIASGPNYSLDFHDVITGNNGYAAGTGWDPMTGLGSPRVATLLLDLAHPRSATSSDLATFLYASPRFGRAPLTVTFHVNATGGTGSYPFEGVSFGDNNSSFAPGGTTTYTFENPGVYSAQAYVADSVANYSVSPPIAIVVGGGTALAVGLTASTVAPARGAPVLFSVGVTGGQSPYLYNFSFGDGTYLGSSSDSSTTHVFGATGSFCAEVVVSDSATPINGGASARVAIGVGGSPLPNCRNDSSPLTISSLANPGVRDAPADFPALFSVSGGSTGTNGVPPSVQYSTRDPYPGACECAIFRSSGNYSVVGYANDSENEESTAVTNVTVARPLVGTFSANTTYGNAPLQVSFRASATGGFGTVAASTVWKFGNGDGAVGASVSATYSIPGIYIAVGHLSDQGHGNASEAFLIDVGSPIHSPGGSASPVLEATVSPAIDVPLGGTVALTARLVSEDGSVIPSEFLWNLGSGSGSYRPDFNWTYSGANSLAANGSLSITLNATDLATNAVVGAGFWLPGFGAVEPGGFTPRDDALAFSDRGGPSSGPAPLSWTGTGSVSGPGTTDVLWEFGDGVEDLDLNVQHFFHVGQYTVVVNATDSWGDLAIDDHPVAAIGTISLTASLSTLSGTAPLSVSFWSNASGGAGPPYQYQWSFGDGIAAPTENASHTYDSVGTYLVSLNVTDSARSFAERNWTVTVTAASSGFPAVILLAGGGVVGVGVAIIAVARRRTGSGAEPTP